VHFSHSSREAFHEHLQACGNLQWVIAQTERGLREAPWTREDEEECKRIVIWFGEKRWRPPRHAEDVDGDLQDLDIRLVHKSLACEFGARIRPC
jgi:hypothetical protein